MRNDNDSFVIASNIANDIDKLRPLDCNVMAMLTAQMLADGKSKCELQHICHFMQLLLIALRTYMDC